MCTCSAARNRRHGGARSKWLLWLRSVQEGGSGTHVCCRAVAKSRARSRMTTKGRVDTAEPPSKKGPLAPPAHARATMSLSCRATISDAPLAGARMMGTDPMVASTEKRPCVTPFIDSRMASSDTVDPLYAAYLGSNAQRKGELGAATSG